MRTEIFNFSLIICTYNRSESLKRLLDSVMMQSSYPYEILIIDASTNEKTALLLNNNEYKCLSYFKVEEKDRGLTRQRNYGIDRSNENSHILCFLDDDIVLHANYFENLISTFTLHPDAIGVGGAIVNDGVWKKRDLAAPKIFEKYYYKEWERKLGSRNVLRKRLGLLSNKLPGVMPAFSNGFSIGFYPPTGEIHNVEYFMGGVSAYRKDLFDNVRFSEYFEGYGLYEDMEFCLRASQLGALYLNTGALVKHLHEESGRPDHFKYGKMVVENGYVVWKLKYPLSSSKNIFKWHAIILLLALIRLKNSIINRESGAYKDAWGRFYAWTKLLIKKPHYPAKN